MKNYLTEEQVKNLLSTFSVKDKIEIELSKLNNLISEASEENENLLEITRLKLQTSSLVNRFVQKEKFEKNDLFVFLQKYAELTSKIMEITGNLALFETITKLQNAVELYVNGMEIERRKELRFPISLSGKLIFEKKETPVSIVNISYNGIGFQEQGMLLSSDFFDKKCIITFQTSLNWNIEVFIKNVQNVTLNKKPTIYYAGTQILKPLSYESLNEILWFSYDISLIESTISKNDN